MRAVNLLPRDLQNIKSIRHEDPAVVVGSALGVIVMIVLGSTFVAAHGRASSEQARLTRAQLEFAQLSAHKRSPSKPSTPVVPITPIVPTPAVTGEEATWLAAVSTNLSQRIAWDRLLREVSLVVPNDVTLEALTMSVPSAASASASASPSSTAVDGFVIQGTAFSYDSVARLLSRLALVPDLSNVTLASTGSETAPGAAGSGAAGSSSAASGVQFNITAAVKGAAPAAAATVPTVPAVTSGTTTGVGA